MTGGAAAGASVGALLQTAMERLRSSGSDSARLDAEVLLGYVLGVDRTGVIAHPEAPVGTGQVERFMAALGRRETGEPVAYIRGFKEFHGLAFATDARALIPRPETELLVDLAVDQVRAALTSSVRPAGSTPFSIWDIGTGSGAVAISILRTLLARGYGDAVVMTATDLSADALALAVENAVSHGVADRIAFGRGDLVDVEPRPVAGFDLVVANLPYVASAAVPRLPVAASFEPVSALDGGADGLDVVRRLLAGLPAVLLAGGAALLEIGSDQSDRALAGVRATLPTWQPEVLPDLAGHARVLRVMRPSEVTA